MVGYKDVKIDETKDKKKYNVHERRSEILKLMLAAGHPKILNQSALAQVYGVSNMMISKDIARIKDEFVKDMGTDAQLITQTVFNGAILSLAKGSNADKFKAAQTAKMWNDWLFDIGAQRKTPAEFKDVSDYDLADAYQEIQREDDESGRKREGKKGNLKRNNKASRRKVSGKT